MKASDQRSRKASDEPAARSPRRSFAGERNRAFAKVAQGVHYLSSSVGSIAPQIAIRTLNRAPGSDVLLLAPRTAQVLIDVQHPRRSRATRVDVITPRTVGEALVDQLALTLLKGAKPATAGAQLETSSIVAELAANLMDSGQVETDFFKYHRQPDTPRAVENHGTVRFRRTAATHYSWPSTFEVPAAMPQAANWKRWQANRTAHLYAFETDPQAPWLINVHGFRQGGPQDFFTFRSGQVARELGINIAHPVLPLSGPRGEVRAPEMLGMDFATSVYGLTQAVWDLRRTILWIRERSDAPIALHGVSLGAYVSSLTSALDDQIEGVIAGIPVVDFPSIVRRHAEKMKPTAEDRALLASPAIDRFFSLVSPLHAESLVDPSRRFIYAGKLDQVSAAEEATKLWKHWGRGSIHWFDGGHVGGAIWDGSVKRYVDGAVADILGF